MKFRHNYTTTGKGTPFFFQHGLGSNLNQPQQLLSTLKNVQLLSMDCPGHGATPLPKGQIPSFSYYTDELHQLVVHLNIKKAIFGGISMGAGISINMAIRYPEKVQALVLVRPAWLDKETPDNLAILLEAATYIGKENGQAAFEKLSNFQNIQQKLPAAAKSILGVFAGTQRKEIPFVLTQLVQDQPLLTLTDLQKVTCPCLIIANDDDPLHPYEMADIIHQYLPNSQLVKVPSRYVDNQQHGKRVTELIATFISAMVKR